MINTECSLGDFDVNLVRSLLPSRLPHMPSDDDPGFISLRRQMPKKQDGHTPDITAMLRGMYRAECSCGEWEDFDNTAYALTFLNSHFRSLRQDELLSRALRRRIARKLGVPVGALTDETLAAALMTA